jgi:hypothetical protein
VYYRNIEQQNSKDPMEGLSNLIVSTPNRIISTSLVSEYNYHIFCGSSRVDNRDQMSDRFGPKIIKIANLRKFAEEVKAILGARRFLLSCGRLRRPYPQGDQSGRASDSGSDQVRPSHQSQDRQGARPRSAADAARPRRRGDRVAEPMSLVGSAPRFGVPAVGGHDAMGGPGRSSLRDATDLVVRCCKPPLNARAIAIRMQAPMKPAIR